MIGGGVASQVPSFSHLLGTTFQIHKEEAVCQKLVRSLAMAAGRSAAKN
jgi:hypothetical protein